MSGTVTSARDEAALEGAEVKLLDAEGNAIGTAITGNDGAYSFNIRILDADYKLAARAEGYVSAEADVENLTSSVEKNFSLETIAKQISGYVKDFATGNALANVAIKLMDGETVVAQTTTSSEGYYELMIDDPTKSYTLEASLEGYKSETVDVPELADDKVMDDIILIDNETLGVEGVSSQQLSGSQIYDIKGRLVSSDGDMSRLKRGEIYIINGKKVMVK